MGAELGSGVTEPTGNPTSSSSRPHPAERPDLPHLWPPVFSRPVLAARSQRRGLHGGRELELGRKIGPARKETRAIKLLLLEERNRCRKNMCKIGANTASSRLRFLIQNRRFS